MKNKILASLLAVCLFAGLAVPAFAEYYSSVEGDATKATMIDFYKDGKVIKELTLKNGESEDIEKIVRVFESKDTLVLDHAYLNYSIEGDTLAFGINESTVNCIDTKGTTTVVVSSTLDSKVVGKLIVKAAPAAAEKFATGFRFKDTLNTITAGAGAEASTIKVVSVPAGSKFIPEQQTIIDAAVKTALDDVLGAIILDDAEGATNDTAVAILGTGATAAASFDRFVISGLRQDETVNYAVVAGATEKIEAAFDATVKNQINLTITSNISGTASAVDIAKINSALRKLSPAASVTAYKANVAVTTMTPEAAVTADVLASDVSVTSTGGVLDDSDATLKYTISAADAAKIIPAAKKNAKVTVTITDGNNGVTDRNVTAATQIQAIKAVSAINIGGPGSITIEVGEVYDTDGKMGYGPTASNVGKAYTLVGDYFDANANANDYAAVDGSKILGVKVGKNKVVASLSSNSNKTATIIVNVVAKGTKPATPDAGTTTTVLSAWAPKIGVGETANIVVKATKAVTYTSLDTAIATVDAAGKLTAVKEGTAKIKVQEEGKDAVYVSLTVTAKTTTPGGTTDVPQTAVVALAPLF